MLVIVDSVDVNTGHTRTHCPRCDRHTGPLGDSVTRGWPYERRPIKAHDSAGKPIEVYVGLAHDAGGDLQLTLAVGDVRDDERSGPTAMLGSINGAELLGALGVTYADFIKRGGS